MNGRQGQIAGSHILTKGYVSAKVNKLAVDGNWPGILQDFHPGVVVGADVEVGTHLIPAEEARGSRK